MQGFNTVPKLIEATGMPRRTAQDTLIAIHELAIELQNDNGIYKVVSWGSISDIWVDANISHMKKVLEYP